MAAQNKAGRVCNIQARPHSSKQRYSLKESFMSTITARPNYASTYTPPPHKAPRRVLSASSMAGFKVVNQAGEDLGKLDQLMIDTNSGRVAYAVLSFGGF